jgi:hypothetical protein
MFNLECTYPWWSARKMEAIDHMYIILKHQGNVKIGGEGEFSNEIANGLKN